MFMEKKDKEILSELIKEINKQNIEEMMYFTGYFIETVARSIFVFGPIHEITKDVIRIWVEFRFILREESELNSFIISNSDLINYNECVNFLNELDELNEVTFLYYMQSLNDINDACDTKFPDRAKHHKRDFKTLIETEDYRNRLVGLSLTFDDVKRSLDYEQDFWDFVYNKTIIVYDDSSEYGVEVIKEGQIDSMVISVPEIINHETALLNKEIFNKAYCLYSIYKEKKHGI